MASHGGNATGTVVDLFSGCGGLSLGAELAHFRSLVAVDIDSTLQSSYRRNFPRTTTLEANVADIDGSAWRRLLGDVRPDGVIGGPPCQGFSFIGRRKKDDPRNSMIGQFFRHVDLLRPRFFVMENVEGLLHGDNAQVLWAALEGLPPCYRVLDPIAVNAAHFGAATTRTRVAVIGFDPEAMEHLTAEMFAPGPPASLATVRDAISDLPNPIPETKANDLGWVNYPPRASASLPDYARLLRAPAPTGLGSPEANARHAAGAVSGMVATRHSREIVRRYASIRGGRSDPITKSYRLEWAGQSPTLRAGTGLDKGAFQAVRPLHPGKGRVITVREAARLQGFPDWFTFHHTKWHSFRMIGNSVSPFVGRGLLARIAARLQLPLAA
ncbi:MAG: DNA cytosine methyltransferase [Caulobacteraceae bacterium]